MRGNHRVVLALGILAVLRGASPASATSGDSATVAAATDSAVAGPGIPAPDLAGYVQVRETLRHHVATTTLNRVRVGAEGKLRDAISYKIQLEAQAASSGIGVAAVALRDAWVRWSPPKLRVTAGQMDTPYSREWIMSTSEIETPDRSVVSEALAPRGDIGAVGIWRPVEQLALTAGAFNGDGQNATANRDSTTLLLGRVEVIPLADISLAAEIATLGSDSTRYGFTAGIERGRVELWGEFLGQSHAGVDSHDEGWYGLLLVKTLPGLRFVARQEQLHRPLMPPERASERGTTLGILYDLRGERVRVLADYVRRTRGPDDRLDEAVLLQLQARFF